jgi:hypothetical protein
MIQAPARKEKGPAKFASHRDGLGVIEEIGSLPEASTFSAEAVGWELIEDAKTGARLGAPETRSA